MNIVFLGTRGLVEEQSDTHKRHSGLLIKSNTTKLLIDVGEKNYLDLNPDAIIVTHAHPDHFNKEITTVEKPVYSTKQILRLLKGDIKNPVSVEVEKPFKIGDITCTLYKTLHSIKTPSVAVRLEHNDKVVVYTSDVLYIYNRDKFLNGATLAIGDGSSLKKGGIVRKDEELGIYGHEGIPDQIAWFLKAGVKAIAITHLGKEAIEKGDKDLEFMLQEMVKEEANRLDKQPVPIIVAKDGLELSMEALVDTSGIISPKVLLPEEVRPKAGIILVKPHGTLLIKGDKQAIVKSVHLKEHIDEPLWLIEDKKILGIVVLTEPIVIDQKQFKELRDKHRITDEEAEQWGFSDKKELYYYPVKVIAAYDTPLEIDYPQGPQLFVKTDNITWLTKLWKVPYEPEKATNEQLADDYRLLVAVMAKLLKGEKVRIQAGKDEYFNKDTLKNFVVRLLKEVARRKKEGTIDMTLHIEEYKEGSPSYELWNLVKDGLTDEEIKLLTTASEAKLAKFPPLESITEEYLKTLSDEDLLKLRDYLHQLYRKEGKVTEPIYDAHILVGKEIIARGIPYPPEEEWDELDKATVIQFLEYPEPAGLAKELTINEFLSMLPERFTISEPPAQIFVAGGIVNRGKVSYPLEAGKEGSDIDIIIKQQYPDDRIIYELLRRLPPDVAKGVHIVYDREGPMIGNCIPIYQLAFSRVTNPKVISPWEVPSKLAELVFGKPVVGLKPKSGIVGKLEFWLAKDAWELFASKYIEENIPLIIERKCDGRRFQLHADKAKGIAKLFTEDRQRDRAPAMPDIINEIMKEGKFENVILDCEIEVYDIGDKKPKDAETKIRLFEMVPREDTASLTTAEKIPESMIDGAVVQVYDILWLDGKPVNNLTTLERIELVHKVVPKGLYWWRPLPYYIATNRKEFFTYLEKVRRENGSEGAIVKAANSTYPIKYSGENRTTEWCLTGGSWILTENGFEQIAFVKEGTRVFGKDGKLHKIIAKSERQLQDWETLYDVKSFHGIKIRATGQHKVLLSDGTWKPIEEAEGIAFIPQIEVPKEEAPTELDLEWHGYKKHIVCDEDFWKLIGFWIAEGSLGNNRNSKYKRGELELSQKDRKILEKYAKIIETKLNVKPKIYDYDCSHLIVWDKPFCDWLSKHFLDKNDDKTLPWFIASLPRSKLMAFLEGWKEGDGYRNRKLMISTSDRGLAGRAYAILRSLGFDVGITYQKIRGYRDNLKITISQEPFHQKHVIVKKLVPTDGKDKVYNIQVEDVESFMTGNLVLSNCKIKNLKEIDLMVWNRIPKVTKEGKELDQYQYDVVYQIPCNKFDEFYGAVKWNGKCYAPIGRTYSTTDKCERGDIITVLVIRVREYEREGKRIFTFMFPCISKDTPVITSEGLRPAGEVKVGDYLLTENGFEPVKIVEEVIKPEQYNIKIEYSPFLIKVDGEHPFLVNERNAVPHYHNYSKTFKPIWKLAKDLKPNDIVLMPKIAVRKPFLSPEWGRLMGAYLGDGTINSKRKGFTEYAIVFNKMEQDLVAFYRQILNKLSIKSWVSNRHKSTTEILFELKEEEDYIKMLYNNGKKFVPKAILESDEAFIKEFIEGLIDSDGTRGKQVQFVNTNLDICHSLVLLLHRLGIVPSFSIREVKGLTGKIKKCGQVAWYPNAKSKHFWDYGNYLGFRVLEKKKIEPEPLVNLVTDSHTFCVPYCLTHNTYKERRTDKKEPDGLEVVERLAEVGTAPLGRLSEAEPKNRPEEDLWKETTKEMLKLSEYKRKLLERILGVDSNE